jgi:hypothetical protein
MSNPVVRLYKSNEDFERDVSTDIDVKCGTTCIRLCVGKDVFNITALEAMSLANELLMAATELMEREA